MSGPASFAPPDDAWVIPRNAVDEREFSAGHIGPFRLGPSVRRTAFGEVILALPEPPSSIVVELDLLDALAGTPLADPTSELMVDLAQVAALRHRHVVPMAGAGFDEGIPYVVRPHRMGRTLRQVLDEATNVSVDLAAAVLHAVGDACDFLGEQGSEPGACSMGGFDDRDVFLSFDGAIGLVGLGLKRARAGAEDPREADLRSCFELARRLDERARAKLPSAVAGASSPRELARAVRRRFPAACAASVQNVGATLRRCFATAIMEEREFFGLPALQ